MIVEIVPTENVTKINKNHGVIRMEFYPQCLCVCVRGGEAADRLIERLRLAFTAYGKRQLRISQNRK